jgi:hypothetical protein
MGGTQVDVHVCVLNVTVYGKNGAMVWQTARLVRWDFRTVMHRIAMMTRSGQVLMDVSKLSCTSGLVA